MSRESVRIVLTHDTLNDVPICACDTQNNYLKVLSSEKKCVICGPEFVSENVGTHAIIVRALRGGKSARAEHWRHSCSAMEEM